MYRDYEKMYRRKWKEAWAMSGVYFFYFFYQASSPLHRRTRGACGILDLSGDGLCHLPGVLSISRSAQGRKMVTPEYLSSSNIPSPMGEWGSVMASDWSKSKLSLCPYVLRYLPYLCLPVSRWVHGDTHTCETEGASRELGPVR